MIVEPKTSAFEWLDFPEPHVEEFGTDGKRYSANDADEEANPDNDRPAARPQDADDFDDLEDLAMAYSQRTQKLEEVGAITADVICRQCQCNPFMACNHPDHGPCWWAELATAERGPLCSHCAMENDHELTADEIERPWKEPGRRAIPA